MVKVICVHSYLNKRSNQYRESIKTLKTIKYFGFPNRIRWNKKSLRIVESDK